MHPNNLGLWAPSKVSVQRPLVRSMSQYFLKRLERMLTLELNHGDHLTKEGKILIHRCIFATYTECLHFNKNVRLKALTMLREAEKKNTEAIVKVITKGIK